MSDTDVSPPPADEASWQLIRWLGRNGTLTEAGSAAVEWAIDRLENIFGGSWPARQYNAHGRIPEPLLGYADRTGLPRLLALATRFDMFGEYPSFREVLSSLKRTPDNAEWRHGSLQLEVARAGVSVGAAVTFEPHIPGKPGRGDVLLRWPGESQLVETSTLSRAELARTWEQYEQTIRAKLHTIALEESLRVQVSLHDHPDEAAAATWIRDAAAAAKRAALCGISFVLEDEWITATFDPDSASAGITSFEGAPLYRDGWARMRRMLRDKIQQTEGADQAWLRLDDHDGLFVFTDWAQAPIQDRLQQIASAVREAPRAANAGRAIDHDHVAGVILSSGLLTTNEMPETAQNQSARTDGAALLRRSIAPHLSRDTAIVTLASVGEQAIERWYTAYSTEEAWLDEDLAARGFPPLADLHQRG